MADADADAHPAISDHNPPSQDNLSKRKPDSHDDPRRTAKTRRLDQEDYESPNQNGEIEKDQNPNPNPSSSPTVVIDKGKGKMIVQEESQQLNPNPSSTPKVLDKGKGKMIVQEESSEDESDDEEGDMLDLSDSEYSDDPLMEVDLNNILPSRTRRFEPDVPGAYLVEDDDDDDDEDDESENNEEEESESESEEEDK